MTTTPEQVAPTVDEKLKIVFEKYLSKHPAAHQWLFNFRHLSHALDDIIDIPERRADNEFIGLVFNKYLELLSSDFYVARRHKLYAVVKSCHHFYFDSLAWEHDKIEWKAKYADVIRCATNQMVVAVVEIAVTEETGSADLGYEAAREVGLLVREKSWLDHHHPITGEPI